MNKGKTVYIDWENWWIRTINGQRLGEVGTYVNSKDETIYRIALPVNDVWLNHRARSKEEVIEFVRQWCEPRGYSLLPKSLENML